MLASHRPGPQGHPATPTRRARARLPLPLAIDISTDAAADGIRPDFYCGDEVYGSCTQLHEHFEATGRAYVLRVPSNFTRTLAAGTKLTCAQAVSPLLSVRGCPVVCLRAHWRGGDSSGRRQCRRGGAGGRHRAAGGRAVDAGG